MTKKRAMRALLAALLIAAVATAPRTVRAVEPYYVLTRTYALGGDGGWDYLTYDAANKHLFISRATRVMVVDPATGAVLAEIPGTTGVHGIALVPDRGEGFTSNGRANTVTVFDLNTFTVTATVPIDGKNPDAIVYDPASKHIVTFNGGSNDATVIDPATNGVVATIPLPGKPEFAASDRAGRLYVNIEDKADIVTIDTRANSVVRTSSLAPCESPSGLAIDVAHHRLFAGCGNKLMAIVDADTGALVTTLPIGEGVDATAFDPATGLAFSSNGGDGNLTIVHENSPADFSVVATVPTRPFARTMALDPNSHAVYSVTAKIDVTPPAPGQTRPTRTVESGTFTLLVVSPQP